MIVFPGSKDRDEGSVGGLPGEDCTDWKSRSIDNVRPESKGQVDVIESRLHVECSAMSALCN